MSAVAGIMVTWVKFAHPSPFSFPDSSNVDIHCCLVLFDHLQFALIHGPNVPSSFAILLFTFIISHIHNWVLLLFWLHLFILSGGISPLFSSSICWPGEFIFQFPIFLPFHTAYGVYKAKIVKWFAIPFSSGPCLARIFHHDQSVLDDPTRHSSWFPWIRQGCGPCDQFDKFSVSLIFFLSALWWIRIRDWWKLPDGRDWLRGQLDVVLMGGAMLSISLIHLSADGSVFVPSLLFDLRPNYLGDIEDNGDLLQKVPCLHCYTQCSWPFSRPRLTHIYTGDSWTLTGKSGSASCGVIALFSWSWCRNHIYACALEAFPIPV